MAIAVVHESHNLSYQKPSAPDKSQAPYIKQAMIIYRVRNSGSLHKEHKKLSSDV